MKLSLACELLIAKLTFSVMVKKRFFVFSAQSDMLAAGNNAGLATLEPNNKTFSCNVDLVCSQHTAAIQTKQSNCQFAAGSKSLLARSPDWSAEKACLVKMIKLINGIRVCKAWTPMPEVA